MKKIINKLKKFNPRSIFLYGSKARKDFIKRSDFEIGVIFNKKNYVSRKDIKKIVNIREVNIYPFEYESIFKGKFDSPFQYAIFLRELVLGGKTIYGEKVIENIKPLKIKVMDIIQDLRFNLGYAFASMHSYRNGDKKTASYEFYKSCLYGTRNLEILKLKKFLLSFTEIYKLSKKLNLGEYNLLVSVAYKVREGKKRVKEEDIFKNISYLNEFIEPQLIKYFNKNGNKTLIK